jgi:hypothetical protein
MFKKSLIALAAIAFAGCTTPSSTTQYTPATHQVEILSEPAGARIEVNDNYVGDTPLTITVATNLYLPTVIRALPIYAGQWTQTKVFGYGLFTPSEVPSRIFFDMRLEPAVP